MRPVGLADSGFAAPGVAFYDYGGEVDGTRWRWLPRSSRSTRACASSA